MIKSGYSFRVAVGHLEDVASRVKEIGWTVGPIADCNSTFSFNRWVKACGPDVRPVFGVQLNVAVDPFGKRPSFDWWTFLAIDKLRPLHDLIELATSQSGPALSYKQALAAEGVIKISGERVLLEHVTESDNYYFGITPAVPKGLLSVAIQRGLPLIAHQCNSYPRTEDREFYRVTLGGRRASTQTYPQHILSDEEWVGTCSAPMPVLMQALQTKGKVLDGCRAVLRQATLLKPQVEKTLHQLCLEGAERLGCDLSRQVYAERLDKELGLIAEKQFEDYFFIIADMVNYAKQHMIVGPARGSSCGSLVCYLLGITTIDPIPFNLIFERFIDTTRADLPDIDLDFSDARRQLVFDYAEEKYGKDRVARLGTVGTFHPRSAMKQAGIELRVPQWRIEKVLEQVIVRSGGDSRALQTLEDTLNDTEAGRTMLKDFPELMIAAKMEGHPSVASQHAAGIVLTQTPIKDYVAIDARTGAAMCDKKDAEDLNLLKIDALGLTQLSIFERTLELIGKPTKNGWLETLPIDDKAAFAVLNKHQFAGIFQFAGSALQSLSKQVNISSIEDIIAITALARPGPLASGGATMWVKRKAGQIPIEYLHPAFEPYLKDEFGVVIYQEQVLRIGREIGDLSWEDVTGLRKAMSRSLGKEFFSQWGDKWKAGAAKRGIGGNIADKVFDDLCAYGSWCLAKGTKIHLSRKIEGKKNWPIEKLFKRFISTGIVPTIHSLFDDGRVKWQRPISVKQNGKRNCNKYIFQNGSYVICTPDHKFIINGSWGPIKYAKIGDEITIAKVDRKQKQRYFHNDQRTGKRYKISQIGFPKKEKHPHWGGGVHYYEEKFKECHRKDSCEDCGKKNYRMEVHHNDFNDGYTKSNDLSWLCPSCHAIRHRLKGERFAKGQRGMGISTTKLVDIKKMGLLNTYDIEMPTYHNFVLDNMIITHNSFNRSHAVAYGMVSYYCCYLKAHHPLEFAAATLDAESDPSRQLLLLRELKDEGIDYLPVDPDNSIDKWLPVKKDGRSVLVGPLTSIKGIGPVTVKKILEARQSGGPLPPSLLAKLNGCKTPIDSLYPISDAVKNIDLEALKIVSDPVPVRAVQCGQKGQRVMIFAVLKRIVPASENEERFVAKRGYRIEDRPTAYLNLFVADDTDEIYVKIESSDFERMGRIIQEEGKVGKSLYAFKGEVPPRFRMIKVEAVRKLGELS